MNTCETPASKDVNPKAEESTTLGAVTKQRLVKTQQAEKHSACHSEL
jgi:hypothetical protein